MEGAATLAGDRDDSSALFAANMLMTLTTGSPLQAYLESLKTSEVG